VSIIAEMISVIRLTRRNKEKVFRYLGLGRPEKIVRLARKAMAAKMGE